MRPKSIVQYEIVYWISIAIALVTNVVGWPYAQAAIDSVAAAQPNAPSAATMRTIGIAAGVVGLAINLLLLWLTARKGNDLARIIASIFFALGLLGALRGLFGTGLPLMFSVAGVAQAVLHGVLLYLVWVPADSKAWFRGKGAAL